MNILFLMKVFEVGGQEKVTAILSECFAKYGHNVSIASFATPKGLIADNLSQKVNLIDLKSEFKCRNEVIEKVVNILEEREIDVVINQWGLPFVPAKVLNSAIKSLSKSKSKPKVIAVYHNDPECNARIKDVEIALDGCKNLLKRSMLNAKKCAFKQVTARSMRFVYSHSDQYQVLSPSYIDGFKKFTGLKHTDHLISLTNPVTIDNSNYVYDFSKKQKEVIYCGRIDYNQKRVSRLIDVWNIIENKCPDWKLTIVGDGVSRKEVEDKAKLYGLKNVQFEGFQQPTDYYKRASILVLTSEYEGFPLVLAECMSFGVVPVVLDSFAAAKDIVHHQKNGVLIPYDKKSGFDANLFASMLKDVMNDDFLRQEMSLAAIETSKEYSIDTIYKQWMKVFEDLKVRP